MNEYGTTDYTNEMNNVPATFGVLSGIISLAEFALAILVIVSIWKVFKKANRPGWAILVPIYNTYVMLKIANKPGWWLLLLLIPFVNFVIVGIMYAGIAKNFGKGDGFAILLFFLPFIGFPMLAFGNAQYMGNNTTSMTPPVQTNPPTFEQPVTPPEQPIQPLTPPTEQSNSTFPTV